MILMLSNIFLKKFHLENPASSVKIIANVYLNDSCDIRAFYAISNNENFEPVYIPFPGYNNLNDKRRDN